MSTMACSNPASCNIYSHRENPFLYKSLLGFMQSPPVVGDKEGAAGYELGELDQALFMYLDGQDQAPLHGQRQTLDIFPSRPMNVEQPSSKVGGSLPTTPTDDHGKGLGIAEQSAAAKNIASTVKREREKSKKGTPSTSDQREGSKAHDPKTLRRLAQNREAARKSRLRKKAYVQQLESSRIRLVQLEQELQRAKAQGFFFGDQGLLASGVTCAMSSEAAMFEMEYGRWVEEHHRMMCELRTAMQQHEGQQMVGMAEEREMRVLVDGCLSHYDEISSLKTAVIKADVFHLMSATWVSPAERCFFWIAGFRPSHVIKIMLGHIEAASEQQLLGIYSLQQSARETEEALTQGLDALNRSLSDTIAADELTSTSANYMAHMALAVNKLSTLEDFVRQAESLRQQTLHRLHQLLTAPQAARCYVGIAEYFHRLRALSSLWLSRPRQE